MARDLLLGKNLKNWSRNSEVPRGLHCGSMLPEGATGYAPTRWWTQEQGEAKIQELMKSGGIFGTSLPRDVAEKKTISYLRKNLIGIMS